MLNENQLKVVNSDPNSNIVCQALAGTGKTTVLLERAKFIVKSRLANKEEPKLLLVAFSKDVANTLLGRLEDDIKDYINIKTTHALAYQEVTRANKKIGVEPGFKIANPNILKYKFSSWLDSNKKRLGRLVWDEELMGLVISISAEMGNDDKAYNNLKTLKKFNNLKKTLNPTRAQELEDLTLYFKQFRIGSGNLMFSDLLGLACSIDPNDLIQYTDVLVDEAQDLNKAQIRLIANIAKRSKGTTWVLDQHQSIFGFQGSVENIVSELNQEYDDISYNVLADNYRCSGNVINLANQVLANEVKTNLRLTPSKEDGSSVQTYSDPGGLVAWINYMKSCGYDQKDIVILYRSSGDLVNIESLLISNGIEYESSDNSFFEMPMVKVLLTAIESSLGLTTYEGFLQLTEFVGLSAATADKVWTATGSGKGFNVNIKDRRLLLSLKNQEANKVQKIVNMISATNLTILAELVADYNNSAASKFINPTKLDDDKFITNNLITWIIESCSETKTILGVLADIKERIRSKPNGNTGIRLITMHSSKGREWPCVAIWNSPIRGYSNYLEEMRLLYVATTRAMSELCIVSQSPAVEKTSIAKYVSDPISDLVREMMYG